MPQNSTNKVKWFCFGLDFWKIVKFWNQLAEFVHLHLWTQSHHSSEMIKIPTNAVISLNLQQGLGLEELVSGMASW